MFKTVVVLFWFSIYLALFLIHLLLYGFDVGGIGTMRIGDPLFPALVRDAFASLILIYSPLYLVPFFLIPYIEKRTRSWGISRQRISTYAAPILLSVGVSLVHWLLLLFMWTVSHDVVSPGVIPFIALLPQLAVCVILTHTYLHRSHASIFPRLTKIAFGLVLFVALSLSSLIVYATTIDSVSQKLLNQAIETGDPDFCKRIPEEEDKRFGIILSGRYNDCIYGVAVKEENETICGRLNYERQIKECKNRVFIQTTPLCEDVAEFEEKIRCFTQATVASRDIELCNKLFDISSDDFKTCSDTVITELALDANDLQRCVYNRKLNRACIEKFFEKTQNPEICDAIFPAEYKYTEDYDVWSLYEDNVGNCYIYAARYFNNRDICTKLPLRNIKGENSHGDIPLEKCLRQFSK